MLWYFPINSGIKFLIFNPINYFFQYPNTLQNAIFQSVIYPNIYLFPEIYIHGDPSDEKFEISDNWLEKIFDILIANNELLIL